jgi:uncharacterized protein YdhG (YjbR/CyaY superfamily)
MKKPQTVDEYIQSAPEEVQEKLQTIRKIVKELVPEAEEKISYAMLYYGYKGRLAYFAYARNHIGLYIPPPIIENHAEELKKNVTAKSTVQFPLTEELPIALIKKLVKGAGNME